MKMILRFVLPFMALAVQANAQSYYKAGATVGTGYSTLRSDLFSMASGRLGLSAGFSIALGVGDRMELNTEIMFRQRGASVRAVRFSGEGFPENDTYDYFYSAFEAGQYVGYFPFKHLPLQVQAGGFFGSHYTRLDQLQRDLWVKNYESPDGAMQAIRLNAAFSGVDFGPVMGISAGNRRVRFNVRYYFGARNMYRNLEFVPPGSKIYSGSFNTTLTFFLE